MRLLISIRAEIWPVPTNKVALWPLRWPNLPIKTWLRFYYCVIERATRYRLPICGWPQRFPLPLQSGLIRHCWSAHHRHSSATWSAKRHKGIVSWEDSPDQLPQSLLSWSFSAATINSIINIPLPYLAVPLRSIVIYAILDSTRRLHSSRLSVCANKSGNYIPINNWNEASMSNKYWDLLDP